MDYDSDQILKDVVKALGFEGYIYPPDIATEVAKLKQANGLLASNNLDLNNVCVHIAKTLGFTEFDDETILVKIERIQQRDEYWHEQYKRLMDEFRAYTREHGSQNDQLKLQVLDETRQKNIDIKKELEKAKQDICCLEQANEYKSRDITRLANCLSEIRGYVQAQNDEKLRISFEDLPLAVKALSQPSPDCFAQEILNLRKENKKLEKELSRQFGIVKDVAKIVYDDYETSTVFWDKVPEEVKVLKESLNQDRLTLLKENTELKRENSQQFAALDAIGRAVVDDYETGIVIWSELPERVKKLKGRHDLQAHTIQEIVNELDLNGAEGISLYALPSKIKELQGVMCKSVLQDFSDAQNQNKNLMCILNQLTGLLDVDSYFLLPLKVNQILAENKYLKAQSTPAQ